MVRQARMTNLRKTEWVIDKIVRAAEQMESPVIAFFGLAYKPDVDDLRESPAVVVVLEVAKRLRRRVLVVEPHVDQLPAELADHADLVAPDAAVERAGMLIPLVAHRVFGQLRDDTEGKTVVDPAGVWS